MSDVSAISARQKILAEASLVIEPRLYKLAYMKDKGFELEREEYYLETRRLLNIYLRRAYEVGFSDSAERYSTMHKEGDTVVTGPEKVPLILPDAVRAAATPNVMRTRPTSSPPRAVHRKRK